jgi:maltooligosyltrehalose trehalohydrolase
VRQGRRQECAAFCWPNDFPDPQAEETFQDSKLNHHLLHQGKHQTLWEFHRAVLQLRRELADLTDLGRKNREVKAYEQEKVLWVWMAGEGGEAIVACSFGEKSQELILSWPEGSWDQRLDSTEERWGGPGSRFPLEIVGGRQIHFTFLPHALAVYLRRE